MYRGVIHHQVPGWFQRVRLKCTGTVRVFSGRRRSRSRWWRLALMPWRWFRVDAPNSTGTSSSFLPQDQTVACGEKIGSSRNHFRGTRQQMALVLKSRPSVTYFKRHDSRTGMNHAVFKVTHAFLFYLWRVSVYTILDFSLNRFSM